MVCGCGFLRCACRKRPVSCSERSFPLFCAAAARLRTGVYGNFVRTVDGKVGKSEVRKCALCAGGAAGRILRCRGSRLGGFARGWSNNSGTGGLAIGGESLRLMPDQRCVSVPVCNFGSGSFNFDTVSGGAVDIRISLRGSFPVRLYD